jgi:hypothetical protein
MLLLASNKIGKWGKQRQLRVFNIMAVSEMAAAILHILVHAILSLAATWTNDKV